MLKNNRLFVLYLLLLLAGCTSVSAPRGSVPKRKAIVTGAYGSWISIHSTYDTIIEGELISVSDDSVCIIDSVNVLAIPREKIVTARVIVFDTNGFEYGLWTFIGSLATLSNGGYLLFTLPAWLLTGTSVATAEANRVNYVDYPASSFEYIGKFARFPQGLPEGLDLSQLRPAR